MSTHFYNVLVSSESFHGRTPLTYSSAKLIKKGALVIVPLRKKPVNAVVLGKEENPPKKLEQVLFSTNQVLPLELLGLFEWLNKFYPAPLGKMGQLFLPSYIDLKALGEKENTIHDKSNAPALKLPPLTGAQKRVLSEITGSRSQSFLLHGDTGSGKTRIYIELIKQQIDSGRSAILLVPEISLTPQLTQELNKSFPGKVIVLHSKLARAARRRAWEKILRSRGRTVVVGPRSALFAPLSNIGLIAVDEAHEPAYKNEKQPHYQTLRVASALANLHSAKLITGTATPLINEYYFAKIKKVPILRLKGLAKNRGPAQSKKISFVDLADHSQFKKHPIVGDKLIKQIESNLKNNRQVLLYLNRRGTARVVLCASCGWKATCPNCALPLVYHSNSFNLRCHTCGFTQPVPSSCPVCHQTDLLFKSFGTKAVEEFISRQFPEASIARIDSDSKRSESADTLFERISSSKIDILIGTQILAKGLDLPNLGLVGVLQADSSLSFPDYTADERTYQLINQVVGRVGRGHGDSEAIIQSYSLNNPTLKYAAASNWEQFFSEQISQRQKYGYPPFYHILKISASRKSKQLIERHSRELAQKIAENKRLKVVGPTPRFAEKQQGDFVWQIIIKSKSRGVLTKLAGELPAGWSYDLDPTNLL